MLNMYMYTHTHIYNGICICEKHKVCNSKIIFKNEKSEHCSNLEMFGTEKFSLQNIFLNMKNNHRPTVVEQLMTLLGSIEF